MSRIYYLLQLSKSDGVHKWSPLLYIVEVHAHIAPSPKASVLHGSEKNCWKVPAISKDIQYRLSSLGGFKINYKKRKKKISKIASYVAYSLLFLVPIGCVFYGYMIHFLLPFSSPHPLLLITYIRLPRLPSSCHWLIPANSIRLPRTTFKQKVCIRVHFHLLIFHLPLDIFKYNRHQRSVAALQPALQARNSTHCFKCFPDALKFDPVQLHRRCDATDARYLFLLCWL